MKKLQESQDKRLSLAAKAFEGVMNQPTEREQNAAAERLMTFRL